MNSDVAPLPMPEILFIDMIGRMVTDARFPLSPLGLIHIGQTCMALGGKAEFFINNVFNFPTLAEAYKIAAYNGLNKLAHV